MFDVPILGGAGERGTPQVRAAAEISISRAVGTSFAHRIPGGANARASSRRLISKKRAGAGLLDFDLLPVGLEFFGEDHGQRGADSLSHFRARDHHGDLVVGSDAQISVRREGPPAEPSPCGR